MISRTRLHSLGLLRELSGLGKSRIEVRQWYKGGTRYMSCRKKTPTLEYYICRFTEYLECLSPWFILHKLKVPRGPIIKFRRLLLRNTYPWISYCLPTATVMVIGDIVAQTYFKGRRRSQNKGYDIVSTLKYALIGFFLVGPLLSKLDLYTYRKLQCLKRYKFLMGKILLDTLLISPIILALVMLSYDFRFVGENVGHVDRLECKYRTPFSSIMLLNLQTRPLMMLFLCSVLPFCVRRHVRGLYEIMFFAFVSRKFRCYQFGLTYEEIMAIRQEEKKKQKKAHNNICEMIKQFLNCMCVKKK